MLSKKNNQQIYACIREQINDVENCFISFQTFMRAATVSETVLETLRALSNDISKKEADADISLRRMIDSMNSSFLPATRQDLISIATKCDRIANKCEKISVTMVYQKFRFPKEFSEPIMKILSITHEQFLLLQGSIGQMFSDLGDLLKDHTVLDEIRQKESLVDEIEQNLYNTIFDMDIGLAERMQLASFVEQVCDISDVIENIADEIQIMLITRKA